MSASAQDHPNVLVIAIDDLRDELGCYGAAHIHSPNIDAVAASGVRFNRAYCQYAVCGPSRASVFSGLRPDSTGVTSNKFHFRDRNPEIVALPQLFKNHGYYTRGLGKILHNNMDDPPSWSEPYFFGEPRVYASDQYAGQLPGIDGIHEKNLRLPVLESADVDDDAYIDGTIADQAIHTIRRGWGTRPAVPVDDRVPQTSFAVQCAEEVLGSLLKRDSPARPQPVLAKRRSPVCVERLAIHTWIQRHAEARVDAR